ncbi:hypothetical protein GCM10027160_34810 [Streptomyces calidiresistens]
MPAATRRFCRFPADSRSPGPCGIEVRAFTSRRVNQKPALTSAAARTRAAPDFGPRRIGPAGNGPRPEEGAEGGTAEPGLDMALPKGGREAIADPALPGAVSLHGSADG